MTHRMRVMAALVMMVGMAAVSVAQQPATQPGAPGARRGGPPRKPINPNLLTKQKEVVHSYGWYLRKFITDAKEKGAAMGIICSPIPRNSWREGKMGGPSSYNPVAKAAADQIGAPYIDLIISRRIR